jgi:hypothetical protein
MDMKKDLKHKKQEGLWYFLRFLSAFSHPTIASVNASLVNFFCLLTLMKMLRTARFFLAYRQTISSRKQSSLEQFGISSLRSFHGKNGHWNQGKTVQNLDRVFNFSYVYDNEFRLDYWYCF